MCRDRPRQDGDRPGHVLERRTIDLEGPARGVAARRPGSGSKRGLTVGLALAAAIGAGLATVLRHAWRGVHAVASGGRLRSACTRDHAGMTMVPPHEEDDDAQEAEVVDDDRLLPDDDDEDLIESDDADAD